MQPYDAELIHTVSVNGNIYIVYILYINVEPVRKNKYTVVKVIIYIYITTLS